MEGRVVLFHVGSLGLEELQHVGRASNMVRQRNQLPGGGAIKKCEFPREHENVVLEIEEAGSTPLEVKML